MSEKMAITKPRFMVPLVAALLLTAPLCPPAWTIGAPSAARANPGFSEEAEQVADDLPPLGFVLDRYVDESGGPRAIDALKTRVARVRVVTDLSSRAVPVYEVDTLSVYSRVGGSFLMVYRTPGGTVIEGFDGKERWKIVENGTVTLDSARGPRDAWLTDPQFPLRLETHFPHMSMAGVETPDGRWAYSVDIDPADSHPVRRLYFDVDTGLLVRLGWNREIRQYREFDGVMVPVEVSYSRKGGSTTYYVESVEHNVKLDPQMFSLAN